MTDQDVRDFLERMAAEEPIPFLDAEPMTRRARRRAARTVIVGAIGVAAAIAVVFASVAAIRTAPAPAIQPTPDASQSPSTSPRPSPSPGFSRFNSTIHGISIDYPSGWQTRPATEPWNHDAVTFGAPDVDVIFDPTLQDDLYFALVSEPLNGQSESEWCCGPVFEATQIRSEGVGCPMGGYTLDGARGWILGCGGQGDAGDHVVVVATATRGYIIQLHVGNARLLETYDGDWFEAALETVDLRSE
jgi:hypothetical protein